MDHLEQHHANDLLNGPTIEVIDQHALDVLVGDDLNLLLHHLVVELRCKVDICRLLSLHFAEDDLLRHVSDDVRPFVQDLALLDRESLAEAGYRARFDACLPEQGRLPQL